MKKAYIMLLIVILTVSSYQVPYTDGIEHGLTSSRFPAGITNDFLCGVKSSKSVFNRDDVFLDFYFGWYESEIRIREGYERVSIAAYFYQPSVLYSNTPIEHEDYKDIDHYHFISEYSPDIFFTEEFATEYKSGFMGFRGVTTFNHHEVIQVPPYLLEKDEGSFSFGIFDVLYSEELNLYAFNYKYTIFDDVEFRYESISDSKIKLYAS